MLHAEFKGLVKNVWENTKSVVDNLNQFQVQAQDWNKRVYGNIFVRKM